VGGDGAYCLGSGGCEGSGRVLAVSGGVVVAVVVVLAVAGVVVVRVRGWFTAGVRLPGMGVKVTAGTQPAAPAGPSAVIKGSKAGRDMTAAGSGGAEITGSEASRDMRATTDPGTDDPKV